MSTCVAFCAQATFPRRASDPLVRRGLKIMRFTRSAARSATLFLAFVWSLASAEDLYDILGIDESATDREIKNACVNWMIMITCAPFLSSLSC